jgi:hypothetical protein
LQNDFFERLNKLSESGKLDSFGNIGFNGIASDILSDFDFCLKRFRKNKKPLCVLGRGCLTDRKWLSGSDIKHYEKLKDNDSFREVFSVESTAWFANMVNCDLYKKYVKADNNFLFFHSWDDVSFQFLNNNIHNIVMPDFYIEHNPDIKPSMGLPLNSTKLAKKGNEKFHRGWGHLDHWFKKWGFNWEDRNTFKIVKDIYKDTLLYSHYKHDLDNGPLKTFKI